MPGPARWRPPLQFQQLSFSEDNWSSGNFAGNSVCPYQWSLPGNMLRQLHNCQGTSAEGCVCEMPHQIHWHILLEINNYLSAVLPKQLYINKDTNSTNSLSFSRKHTEVIIMAMHLSCLFSPGTSF